MTYPSKVFKVCNACIKDRKLHLTKGANISRCRMGAEYCDCCWERKPRSLGYIHLTVEFNANVGGNDIWTLRAHYIP